MRSQAITGTSPRQVPTWVLLASAAAITAAALVIGAALPSRLTPGPQPGAAGALPGVLMEEIESVTDAVFADSRWYVADLRANRVHVLDSAGQLLRTIGRKGRGPGEFYSGPLNIAVTGGRIYTSEVGRGTISVFDTSGLFIHGFNQTNADCRPGSPVALSAGGGLLHALVRCVDERQNVEYRVYSFDERLARRWAAPGFVVRKLPGGSIPLHYPVLVADGDHVILGDGGAGCLRILLATTGDSVGSRCLDSVPRVRLSEELRRKVAGRSRGPIELPDSLPRVAKLRVNGATWAVVNAQTPREGAWLLVAASGAVTETGLAVTDVSDAFPAPGSVLVVHEDSAGVRLTVRPLPW